MADTTKIPLVATEITGIWNSYIGETLFRCVLKHFSTRVDDEEIRDLLLHSLELSNERISILTNIFKVEKLPVPEGFTDKDVDLNAPRLFTDTLYLKYLAYSSRVAMRSYSLYLNRIARSDLRSYFSKCIIESVDLSNRATELSLAKGFYLRAPHVEVCKEVQYIKNENFFVDLFGKKRSLLTDEITHITAIASDTIIRRALIMGFGQVCKDKKVSDYISRVMNLSAEQNKGFMSILAEENIPLASPSDSFVTDSVISPFSDKLIISKILVMYRVKITNIGLAMADISRADLKSTFMQYLKECMEYAEDASSIMIKQGWMEQPPQAINHENLVGV